MKELIYPRMLFSAVRKHPDDIAFLDGDQTETFASHLDRSQRLVAAHHAQLGLSKTDTFAVLAGNSRHYVNLWHAALLGGGILNPLNTRLAPAEIAFILKDAGTTVLYTESGFEPAVSYLRSELPDLKHIVLMDDGDCPHNIRYRELVASTSGGLYLEPEEDDLAMLMYTGGTTGLPKGVKHTQRSLTLNVYRLNVMLKFFIEPTSYLNATPMFHAAATLGAMAIPASGGVNIIQHSFDPGQAIELIEKHNVTMTGLVPTMIGMILQHPAFQPERLKSLKRMMYGASPIQAGLLNQVFELFPGLEIVQTYGMTEGAAVLTCLNTEDHARGGELLKSAGRCLPGSEVSIQDHEGNLLPPGEVGEVCAKSGSIMLEYHNRPDETRAAFRNGWYLTGDMGYLDERDYLYLVDRSKDMIVSGGENIYSAEVESAISTHPAVAQVAVIGIPDPRWGEAVHAVLYLKPGRTASEEEIILHTRGLIAGYKVPKSVTFRDEPLPLSGAMKVLKRDLRAPFWKGRERNID
jgi:acyl-CoA synthetase (AMP-forming)/AMP-acid ligase II